MRLLWLDINASYSHSSLALPALHSQLSIDQLKRAEWKVLSGTINSDPATLLIEMLEYKPDVVLSTLWLFNHSFLTLLISKFKAIYPDSIAFLGGPEFLGDNYQFLNNNRFIDAVFRGEGEEVFPQIFEEMANKRKWKNLRGVCSINLNNEYLDNGSVVVDDFIKLSPPENSFFFNWEKPFVQIETSRGCFNKCSFCVSGSDARVQNIPINKIEERLKTIKSKGIREVRVLDRTFNANPKRASELLELFSKYHGEIQFHLEIHPAILTQEFKDNLEKVPAGTLHLEAGLQSLDNNVLKACNRTGSSEKSLEGIQYLFSLNKFELHVDLIAGLPLYTYNGMIQDINRLVKVGVEEIQVELLKLLPGTELRQKSDSFGISHSPFPPYEVLNTPAISTAELYKISILSKVIDVWYNNDIWRNTFRQIVCLKDNFLEEFLDYITTNQSLSSPLSLESKGILLYEFCRNNFNDLAADVAATWIEAGLSLKKGPGKIVNQWIRNSSKIINPLFDETNLFINYYYFEENGKSFWYAFDKRDKKGRPIKSYRFKQNT